jgi:hypothetical protein
MRGGKLWVCAGGGVLGGDESGVYKAVLWGCGRDQLCGEGSGRAELAKSNQVQRDAGRGRWSWSCESVARGAVRVGGISGNAGNDVRGSWDGAGIKVMK